MLTIYNANHARHHGKLEMFRGELVPCFEIPARADYVLQELQSRKLGAIDAPQAMNDTVITRAHSGKPCRVVRSAFSDAWSAPGAPEPLDMPYQQALTGQLLAAVEEHHIGPLMYEAAGQSVAWLREIEPVDQVMQRLVSQTRVALQALKPYL